MTYSDPDVEEKMFARHLVIAVLFMVVVITATGWGLERGRYIGHMEQHIDIEPSPSH